MLIQGDRRLGLDIWKGGGVLTLAPTVWILLDRASRDRVGAAGKGQMATTRHQPAGYVLLLPKLAATTRIFRPTRIRKDTQKDKGHSGQQ